MINKRGNIKSFLNFFIYISIIISTCFLSVGYAAIGPIELNIDMTASATAHSGIFISDVTYSTSNDADLVNSEIVDYLETVLHSDVYLSTTNTNSSITYSMTIFNNSNSEKIFKGVTYAEGFYSNSDITYEITGLNIDDSIQIGEGKTFSITFTYGNISSITNNQLDSYLSFNFEDPIEDDTDVDIFITGGETYTYAGVTSNNPININNAANIDFIVKNSNQNDITSINVNVTYTNSTGKGGASISVTLYDENNTTIQTQTLQFQAKQTNAVGTVTFNNLNIGNSQKISVRFATVNGGNGKTTLSNVTITPNF